MSAAHEDLAPLRYIISEGINHICQVENLSQYCLLYERLGLVTAIDIFGPCTV